MRSFVLPAVMLAQFPNALAQFEVWTTATSDIPSDSVICVLAPSSAVTWVGTDQGLARFDGAAWEVFMTGNSPIRSNIITALATASDGALWVGTDRGLQRFDGVNWSDHTTSLADSFVTALKHISTDYLYVGTRAGGLDIFNGTTWQVNYNEADSPFPEGPVAAIEYSVWTPTHFILAGTPSGLMKIVSTSIWHSLINNNGNDDFPSTDVRGLALDGQTLWVALAGGLCRANALSWNWTVHTASSSGLPSDSLECVRVDLDGSVWIGHSDVGLTRFRNYTWTNFSTMNTNLPGDRVNDIDIDPNGTIWIATTSGLARKGSDVGIERISAMDRLAVSPNPAGDVTQITGMDARAPFLLRIHDAQGRTCHSSRGQGTAMQVDVSALEPGIYTLRMESEHHHGETRLIVAR